jgi:DNA-binding IclR family transcriptional regulator
MTETIEAISDASESTSGVAVLDRAFALLGAFGVADARLTLTELSRRTGLYKSTVLRLLGALEHGGYIRKTPDGLYAIGPEPLRLAAVYQGSFSVAHVIEPLLAQITMNSGETASFYIRRANKRVVLFRAEPPRAVRFSIRVGEEFPLNQGASGKVLVAFDGKTVDREGKTPLWRASYGERDPETVSLAVPVFGVTGEFHGALTLSGPKSRMATPEIMAKNCRQLLEAARKATATLGGSEAIYESSLTQLDDDAFKTNAM